MKHGLAIACHKSLHAQCSRVICGVKSFPPGFAHVPCTGTACQGKDVLLHAQRQLFPCCSFLLRAHGALHDRPAVQMSGLPCMAIAHAHI